MYEHFLIYAVNTFNASVDLRRFDKFLIFEAGGNRFLYAVYKCFALAFLYFENMLYFGICKRIEIMEGKIFKLFFDSSHSKAVCDRRINVHCFMRCVTLFYSRAEFKRSHIMKPVGKLYYNYSYILRHCKHHFSDVFRLLLLFVEHGNLIQLGYAVYKHCDILPKAFFYFLKRCMSIFNDIMEHCGAYCVGVHSQLEKDI